ncbi:MAG: type I restriction-modification system subunit M N-terminal domain-containing protein [Acidimicrobiales bacterium]
MARAARNDQPLGFEDTLWKAADKLRGSMDASEYKHVLAATLSAHEPAAFREHGSAGLDDHGGPLAASMSTISPG